MNTLVLKVNSLAPEPEAIAHAAAILRGGGLVAFPTETVYGLGANALDTTAVERIFRAKGRPAHNPIIVHAADLDSARSLVAGWPRQATLLAERFWPGPLTLVLSKSERVPAAVTAGGPTVALRVPGHAVALALLRACQLPLAAPSANRSSELSPTRSEHVLRGLEGRIDLLLDAGPTPGGLESTVLDLTVVPARLWRPGLVSLAELEAVLGPVSVHDSESAPAILKAPGQLQRHYAPRTPLEIAADDGCKRVETLGGQGLRVGWLTFAGKVTALGSNIVVKRLPSDAASYAAQLYAALHQLDDAGVDRIVVSRPPDTEEWLAVRDRLRRAETIEAIREDVKK